MIWYQFHSLISGVLDDVRNNLSCLPTVEGELIRGIENLSGSVSVNSVTRLQGWLQFPCWYYDKTAEVSWQVFCNYPHCTSDENGKISCVVLWLSPLDQDRILIKRAQQAKATSLVRIITQAADTCTVRWGEKSLWWETCSRCSVSMALNNHLMQDLDEAIRICRKCSIVQTHTWVSGAVGEAYRIAPHQIKLKPQLNCLLWQK